MRLRVLWNFDNCNSNVREEIKQIKIELKIQNLNLVRYFCALPLDKSLNIYIQWWWQCNPRNDDLKQFMNQNDMTELLADIQHLSVVPICQYFFIFLTSSLEIGTNVPGRSSLYFCWYRWRTSWVMSADIRHDSTGSSPISIAHSHGFDYLYLQTSLDRR